MITALVLLLKNSGIGNVNFRIKYATTVFGKGLHRLSGAPYSWGNRLRNILLEIGLKSKFIRMDRGDFIIALDKKPESRFVQCGDIVILIEKLETEVKAKETAKSVVVKYREAKTSYVAVVKKSLTTTKKPTPEVQVVEYNVNSLREKTNETIERLQKEVKDMQIRHGADNRDSHHFVNRSSYKD